MRRRRSQAGEGQGGCIIGLIILLAAVLVAYKMIPVKVKAADLRQTVTDEARSAGSRNDAVIKKAILHKAEILGLPVAEQNVQVRRVSSYIYVDVSYTVPIQFPGYTYNWKFKHHAENPIF